MSGPEENVILAENPRGALIFKGNELRIVSKVLDPAALRLDAPIGQDGGGGGKISYNALREDGGEEELAFCIGRQREAVRPDTHNYSGELVTFIRDGAVANADDGMRRVAELTCDGSMTADGGPISPTHETAHLVDPSNRYRLELQADGNLVVYDTHQTPWKALWSIQTGPLA